MRKRYTLAAGAAILAVLIVAVSIFNNVIPVSAQTILDRAAEAQSAQAAAQGIQHTRIEIYSNPQAIEGAQAGTTIIDESYYDPATGYYRFLTLDTTGKMLDVASFDGSFFYEAQAADISDSSVTIHRRPLAEDEIRKQQSAGVGIDMEISPFEHFRSNPRVELAGKETWADGRQVYVLISRNSQTQKLSNGQSDEIFTGTVKMVFDAQTYQLVGSETTVYKNGREIVIEKVRFLVDEILQPGSPVDWSLSELQNATFVDEQPEETVETSFEVLSEQQLTERANDAYILKNIPAGFTLEIVAAADQPQDQPYAYEIHYNGPSGAHFSLQAVGVMDAGFIETSFYDGSYKSTTGLVLNYSSSRPENSEDGTSALLTVPGGTSFLLWSTLPRPEVEALVEDLIPLE